MSDIEMIDISLAPEITEVPPPEPMEVEHINSPVSADVVEITADLARLSLAE